MCTRMVASSAFCLAPSNGTPWYKNSCITSALAKGAASTGLDVIGLLPEGGAVSAAFSLWHGAAAVSQGTKLLQGVKVGAGITSTASAGSEGNWFGGVTGTLTIGASLVKAAPVVGQVLSAISIVGDAVGTRMAMQEQLGLKMGTAKFPDDLIVIDHVEKPSEN
jgi:hypothetical protein